MKPIAVTVSIWDIPINRYKWFYGRCLYQTDIRNSPEAAWRLTWLSEGSLRYQIGRCGGPWVHGGDQEEIKLYKEFRAHLAQPTCNQLIKPNGP